MVSSVEELLAGATSREPFGTTDSKSGSAFERVVIDGESLIVKHVHIDDDWTMRFNGDIGCHPAQVWQAGLMDVLPERIDHGVVAVAAGLGRNCWGAAILMRDLSDAMVPPGDDPLDVEQHVSLIDDLAALSARHVGMEGRRRARAPRRRAGHGSTTPRWRSSKQRGWPDPVPKIAFDGWERFADRAPADVFDTIDALRRSPAPLVTAMRETPLTFVHGDWKLGNLGTGSRRPHGPDRLDVPGRGPLLLRAHLVSRGEPSADAACPRRTRSTRFRSSLEANGIDTAGWFDRQLTLSLLAGLVVFGWEKALGDDDGARLVV